MMTRLIPAALCGYLLLAAPAQADERYEHFSGAPANSIPEAISNIEVYNEHLATLLAKDELSPGDLGQIHQLSYSLENALQRLDEELELAQEALEELHLGSEQLQYERVNTNGKVYLEKSRALTQR